MAIIERQTIQRIIYKRILEAAGAEENRLILSEGQFFQRSPSRELILFQQQITNNITYWRHGRFYKMTGGEYYIFDTGTHNGSQEQAQEEEPEPEPKAIKLYYYEEKYYRQKKNGVIAEDNTIQAIAQSSEEKKG